MDGWQRAQGEDVQGSRSTIAGKERDCSEWLPPPPASKLMRKWPLKVRALRRRKKAPWARFWYGSHASEGLYRSETRLDRRLGDMLRASSWKPPQGGRQRVTRTEVELGPALLGSLEPVHERVVRRRPRYG